MTYPLVTLLVHAHPIRSGDAKLAAAKDEYLRDRRVIAIAPNVQKRLDGKRLRLRRNLTHFHGLIRILIVPQAVLVDDNKAVAVVIDGRCACNVFRHPMSAQRGGIGRKSTRLNSSN